ncbi:class I SAM-dependent methyltransferase [Candidatus Uhrbacteria bacterium]|nr:class I SAM-dependent methyltransferase [Candidatus Uhrbacteria bacterium]
MRTTVHPVTICPLGENAKRVADIYTDAKNYHIAASPGGRICYQLPERTLGILGPHLYQSDRVLDLGCGSGLVGRALFASGYAIALSGIDCSLHMLELAYAAKYSTLFLGDISQIFQNSFGERGTYEWAVAIGSSNYLTTDELTCLLNFLMRICRKGICLSIERFTPEFIRAVDTKYQGNGPKIYDHSTFFDSFRPENGWGLFVEDLEKPAWISPSTGIQVMAKLALLKKTTRSRSF